MGSESKTLVIGIGNEYRGDDAVGLIAARQLSKSAPDNCHIKEATGEGTRLIGSWEGYDNVIIVDAIRSKSAAGTIHRVDAIHEKLPDNWTHQSSHTVSLPEAIRLAQTLGVIPKRLTIYGIEGDNFDPGAETSQAVQQAVQNLIPRILNDIESA